MRASGKQACNFSISAVASTTSPIKAVCMTRNFCTRKNKALGPDDRRGAVGVPFNDCGRFARSVIFAAVFSDIIHAFFNARVYLPEEGGSRLAGDIGGGGNEGFAEE